MDQNEAQLLFPATEAGSERTSAPQTPEPAMSDTTSASRATGSMKARGRPRKVQPPNVAASPTNETVAQSDEPKQIPPGSVDEAHRRLAEQLHIYLLSAFPKIRVHSWLVPEIDGLLKHKAYSMGSQKGFTSAGIGKSLFPKWADNVEGPFQPSLATMLSIFGAHEVLGHPAHDKFRCVVAEHHIVARIDALLSDPTLTLERSKEVHWTRQPFNIVNGQHNVPLPTQQEIHSEHAQSLKREALSDSSVDPEAPVYKRPRTSIEEDGRVFLSTFLEKVKGMLDEAFGDAEKRLEDKILASHAEITATRADIVATNDAMKNAETEIRQCLNADIMAAKTEITATKYAVEQAETEIRTCLDAGLEAVKTYIMEEANPNLHGAIQADMRDASAKTEKAMEEQSESRFAKFEDLIKEELRPVPAQDQPATGYPFFGMPNMNTPLNQGQLASSLIQLMFQQLMSQGVSPQPPALRKSSRADRADQQQTNFGGRRNSPRSG
ncbi:hypothetical protein LIA77_00624 [Sarocladium implicatum]|nr:hypothetical protein LIA77_00624 [Sarocladium implicatum]